MGTASSWSPRLAGLTNPRAASLTVFLLALIARISSLPAALASPTLARPILDAASYDAWGQRLAAGDWLGEGVFFQDPLYPDLLGPIYALVGHHPAGSVGLQRPGGDGRPGEGRHHSPPWPSGCCRAGL